MPRTLALVGFTLLLACRPDPTPEQPVNAIEEPPAPGSEPDPAPAPAVEAQLRWELSAEPTRLTMAQRERFVIEIAVTNEGSETIAPPLHAGDFQLDGQSHVGLNLWFSNGAISQEWMALAPGQTARDRRKPGEQLFEAPGEYVLSYVHGPTITSVTVTVTK
ncbi:MAG: hypothetical protein R6X02_27905 [Enhygromyxa sp.]